MSELRDVAAGKLSGLTPGVKKTTPPALYVIWWVLSSAQKLKKSATWAVNFSKISSKWPKFRNFSPKFGQKSPLTAPKPPCTVNQDKRYNHPKGTKMSRYTVTLVVRETKTAPKEDSYDKTTVRERTSTEKILDMEFTSENISTLIGRVNAHVELLRPAPADKAVSNFAGPAV